MVAVNALERTQPQYEALGLRAGWRLEKVWKTGKDGAEGPYRHYEFRLSKEQIRKNRKKAEGIAAEEELVERRPSRSNGMVVRPPARADIVVSD